MFIALLGACQTTTTGASRAPEPVVDVPAPSAVSECGDSTTEQHITWRDDAIVHWRFVLDPETGAITTLGEPSFGVALNVGHRRRAGVRYEAGREWIELHDLSGNLVKNIEVPVFVEAPDLDAERVGMLRATSVYWWTGRDLLVVQDLLPSEAYISCRMLDVETSTWGDLTSCPEGDMIDLYDVQRGPSDLVALSASGEGHPAVTVVHWAPNTGPQRPSKFPSFDLYPFGPMSVQFTDDPEVLFIETPCDLRVDRGCQQKVSEDEDHSVFLFRWREDGLSLERSGLPPGATFQPGTGTWAWPTTKGVAIGDPDGDFDCHEFAWPSG